jgi:hypothetical protein
MTNQHTNPDTFLVEEYGKITMVISQMRRRFESVHWSITISKKLVAEITTQLKPCFSVQGLSTSLDFVKPSNWEKISRDKIANITGSMHDQEFQRLLYINLGDLCLTSEYFHLSIGSYAAFKETFILFLITTRQGLTWSGWNKSTIWDNAPNNTWG